MWSGLMCPSLCSHHATLLAGYSIVPRSLSLSFGLMRWDLWEGLVRIRGRDASNGSIRSVMVVEAVRLVAGSRMVRVISAAASEWYVWSVTLGACVSLIPAYSSSSRRDVLLVMVRGHVAWVEGASGDESVSRQLHAYSKFLLPYASFTKSSS